MHNGSLNLVFEYCVTDMERVINDKTMVLDAASNPTLTLTLTLALTLALALALTLTLTLTLLILTLY